MRPPNRSQVLTGVLILMACIAMLLLFSGKKDSRPPPVASGYYTGPFRSRNKDKAVWSTDDGKIVPPPPGADTSLPKSSSRPGQPDGPGGL
jgi:hypothetical protein